MQKRLNAQGVLEDEREPLAIREEIDYAHDDLAIEAANEEDQLNDGQKKFYDEVLAAVENEVSVLFGLDAPGKTLSYLAFYSFHTIFCTFQHI